ncbi:hypothetical protein FRB94_013392 [Tulasnella sp. JGI-2019a]|nr:hypothetical protein FRB93_002496 [Tulasnella sp. JGI-2019a]KAG9008346.1 hypothetical protein FRB94_013392 [Tulasnella sp. JGI-2019a]
MSASPPLLRLSPPWPEFMTIEVEDYPASSIGSPPSSPPNFDSAFDFFEPSVTFTPVDAVSGSMGINPFNLPVPAHPDDGTVEISMPYASATGSDPAGTFGFPEFLPLSPMAQSTELLPMQMAELEEYDPSSPVGMECGIEQLYQDLLAEGDEAEEDDLSDDGGVWLGIETDWPGIEESTMDGIKALMDDDA